MGTMGHPRSREPPPRLSIHPLAASMRRSISLAPSPARGSARMTGLPSGTVTFLFTDIEGSTARWERDPVAMGAAMPRHDALLNRAVEEHGGRVFKTLGDGICAAFPDAVSAVAAAVEAQRVLMVQDWGGLGP